MTNRNDLLLTELSSLRSEVNAVIDRMNGNENFSAGTISAVYAFILTNKITFVSTLLSLLSIVIVLIGMRRYFELRVHARKIDNYLMRAEKYLDVQGGWTCAYYNSIEGSATGGYSVTRWTFWRALTLASILGVFYSLYILIYAS